MKKIVLFLLCIGSIACSAQTNPTIGSSNGQQYFCLTGVTFQLEVSINRNGFAGTIDHFTIDWGDGSTIQNVSVPEPPSLLHSYDFTGFYHTCTADIEKTIILKTFASANDPNPLNNSFIATFRNPPTAGFTYSPDPVCINQAVTFTATICPPGCTYTWNINNGPTISGNSTTYTFTADGSYNVKITATNLCGSDTHTETIVISTPVAKIKATADSLCEGSAITLIGSATSGTPKYTYTWSPATNSLSIQNDTVSASPAGNTTYTLTVKDSKGCSDTAQMKIYVIPTVQLTVTATDNTLCQGAQTSISVSGGNGTYEWSPATGLNATTGTSVVASPTITTTYTVKESGNAKCTPSKSVIIQVETPPVLNLSPVNVCYQPNNPQSVNLGIPYAGGMWSLPATPQGVFTPTGVGNVKEIFSFTSSTPYNCLYKDSMTVQVTTATIAYAGKDTTFCDNIGSFDLNSLNPTPSSANGGSWVGTGNIFTPPSGNGTYTFTYTCGSGTCKTSDDVTITVNASPSIPSNSFNICTGNSQTITVSGAQTYAWTPATGLSATTGNSVVASPTAVNTYTYTVSGTGSNGCVTKADETVVVNALPTVNFLPNITLCLNNPKIIQLSGSSTYQWTPSTFVAAGSDAQHFILTCPSNTTYTVVGTSGPNCTASAIVTVKVDSSFITASTMDSDICTGEKTILTAAGNATGFTWAPSFGLSQTVGATVTANPSITTTYTVTALSNNGGACPLQAEVAVYFRQLPPVTLKVNSMSPCSGQPSMLTATGAQNYSWSPATYLSSSTANPTIATPYADITYTVTGTDIYGCTASNSISIHVLPTPHVFAGTDFTCCLTPHHCGFDSVYPNYGTWSSLTCPQCVVNDSIDVLKATLGNNTFYYTVTDANGCSANDSVIVNVYSVTYPNAGPDFKVCYDGTPIKLVGSPPGGRWYGFPIDTAGNVDPLKAGFNPPAHDFIYTIHTGQCATSDTAVVTIFPLPTLRVSPNNITLCTGDSVYLTAEGTNITSYQWNPTATLSFITDSTLFAKPVANTSYVVTATDRNGCTNDSTVIILVYDRPKPSITPSSFTACINNNEVSFDIEPSPNNIRFTVFYGDNSAPDTTPPWKHSYKLPGTYIVSVQAQLVGTQCYGYDSIKAPLRIFANPRVQLYDAVPLDSCLQIGKTTWLYAISPDSVIYTWEPASDVMCSYCYSTATQPLIRRDSEWFYLTVTDTNSCSVTDSISVCIECNIDNSIHFPTAFTPNNDNINETFHMDGYKEIPKFFEFTRLRIYDRVGQKVFESTDPTEGWDGKYNEKVLEPNVFVYYLDYLCNGKPQTKEGSITLLK